MRELKQDVIDEVRNLQGLDRLGVGRGSSIPQQFFEDIAREMGLGLETTMPAYARAIIKHAGLNWEEAFSSETTRSGGGSTVTWSGLNQVRNAYILWRSNEDNSEQSVLQVSESNSWLPPFNWTELREQIERSAIETIQRPGAQQFRTMVMAAYGNKCAITGTDFPGVLEAAHIVPYFGEESDNVQNALLLRVDIHRLFDAALFDLEYQQGELVVSWASDAVNDSYHGLLGSVVATAVDMSQSPSPAALAARRAYLGLPLRD